MVKLIIPIFLIIIARDTVAQTEPDSIVFIKGEVTEITTQSEINRRKEKYPNPFAPSTPLQFSIQDTIKDVTLTIADLDNFICKTWSFGLMTPGKYYLNYWAFAKGLISGPYIFILENSSGEILRKRIYL